MSNFTPKNIDFCRQVLLEKISRPLPVLAIYPKNTSDTKLLISIANNGTVIALRYIGSTIVNESISYVGKSVDDIVQEINALNIPVQAASIHNTLSLKQGDIVSTGGDFVEIPLGFTAYDRVDNGGVVIRAKKIAVIQKSNSKIRTLEPYFESAALPWYLRISNGSFSQKYKGKLFQFYIPEFDNQVWSSKYGKPFKDLFGVQPSLKEQNVYQLPRYPIFWNGQNITVYNGEAPVSEQVIEDVDINNGLLYIRPNASLKDDFYVDYTYLESSYIYRDININGHFSQNPLILDKFVVIYILPAESNRTVRKRTVFHSIGDSVDEAINSIKISEPDIPIAIIGAYNIQQYFSSDKVSLLDTRSLGGGLIRPEGPKSTKYSTYAPIESKDVPIEDLYEESYRFWDIGNYDGEAYPGAAAVAVDLPIDLQEVLPLSDIKKKSAKFMAAGVYPSIRYTERELPSITGSSSQVSCAYNLDFKAVFTGLDSSSGIYASTPQKFTGVGWALDDYNYPRSIFSGDWDHFNPQVTIEGESSKYIQIGIFTGAVMPFLKSTAWAGISWEERNVVQNVGSVEEPVTYSEWQPKKYLDTTEALSGQLIKSYLTLEPANVQKQYRNIKIHSPFITGNLQDKLEESLKEIIDVWLSNQASTGSTTYGTEILTENTQVGSHSVKKTASDFTLCHPNYYNIFDLGNTPIESYYSDDLYKIGYDFISSGTYSSGHYFRPFLQSVQRYVTIGEDYPFVIFQFNNELKALNNYLDFRRRTSTWSSDCDSGALASTGLAYRLMKESTNYSGPFEGGIPIYWTYYPINVSEGYLTEFFSGFKFDNAYDLGGSYSEVLEEFNQDYQFNFSLPAILSTCLANSGQLISDPRLSTIWKEAYDLTVSQTVNRINSSINATRTYSGFPTTTHWFVGHNRLGTYFGNTIYNITESYDYLRRYNETLIDRGIINSPTGISPNSLNYMFSGIEVMLDAAYDAVYNNVLRLGITESSAALAIYGYGWYLNNWKTNYGIRAKTYSTDKREKYKLLFDFGLKQMIKNQVTPNGDFLEIDTINGNAGPFRAATPSKILYPLSQAVAYDYDNWAGVAEAVINTITNQYSEDGLYYLDPYKQSASAGAERNIFKGLSQVYKSIAETGRPVLWEPIKDDLSNLRYTEFLPPFEDANLPGDWQGTNNSLAFWKYYSTGEILNYIDILKTAGFNAISVPLDYIYWKESSGEFFTKLDDLILKCVSSRMRVIPCLLQGGTVGVTSGQESGYVNNFGHTGSYYYTPITDANFLSGVFSGKDYVEDVVNRYDNSTAVIAWNIIDQSKNNAQSIATCNSFAYYIKQITDTPVIYTIDVNLSNLELNGLQGIGGSDSSAPLATVMESNDIYNLISPIYNPNVDFIGIKPNAMFGYYLDALTGVIPSSKPKLVFNYGNGAFSDYSSSIGYLQERNLPIGLSNFYVSSGKYEGNLYSDRTTRNERQLGVLRNISEEQGVLSTGLIPQVKIFNNKYLYPTGYIPGYTPSSVINKLSNWTLEPDFSSTNSGYIYSQTLLLNSVHSGLDTLNYIHSYTSNSYVVPRVLTTEECNNLNYFKSTWDSNNPYDSNSNTWLLSGDVDYSKYSQFLKSWGEYLYFVIDRLGITNG